MRFLLEHASAWNRLLSWILTAVVVLGIVSVPIHAATPADPAPSAEPGFVWSAFLGPFHVLLLHFPIGVIAAVAILEVWAWRRPNPEFRIATRILLWLAFASGLAASVAGLFQAESGGFDVDLATEHRNFAFAFVASTLGAAIASHALGRRPECRRRVISYRVLLVFSLLLVMSAAHHGGGITHGTDFLTKGAPPFIATIFGEPSKNSLEISTGTQLANSGADPAVTSQKFFADTIQPLFESRCYACHGPEKQRGDFRLDVVENALRGGDSGSAAITPGEPMKSNLLRVLLLPRDHDDAMPPEGKQGLTPDEILTIAHWIQSGAAFDEARPGSNP